MPIRTRNMNLEKPVPGSGPESDTWAEAVVLQNQNLDKIADHDHTAGKGVAIPVEGLNINRNLDLNNRALVNALFVQLSQTSHSAAENNTFYRGSGNDSDKFFYKNSAGVSVDILNFTPDTTPRNLVSQIVTLATGTDFNTLGGSVALAENHIYIVQGGQTYQNAPSDLPTGVDFKLIVLVSKDQYLLPMYGSFYYKRRYTAGAWTAWVKVKEPTSSADQAVNFYYGLTARASDFNDARSLSYITAFVSTAFGEDFFRTEKTVSSLLKAGARIVFSSESIAGFYNPWIAVKNHDFSNLVFQGEENLWKKAINENFNGESVLNGETYSLFVRTLPMKESKSLTVYLKDYE